MKGLRSRKHSGWFVPNFTGIINCKNSHGQIIGFLVYLVYLCDYMRQSFNRFGLLFFFIASCFAKAYSQSGNPFEISSRLDSVAKLPKTAAIDSFVLSSKIDSTGETSISASGPVDNPSVNPFDVDHQPLRKMSGASKNKIQPSDTVSQGKNPGTNTFLFWILLLATALLAIVINVRFSVIRLVFRSLINMNLFKLFHREEGGQITVSSLFLYIIFLANVAVAGYLVLQGKNQIYGLQSWLLVAGVISAFYLIKHGLIVVLGSIFSIQKTTSLYNFSIFSYHVFLGIILLPVNLTAAFAPGIISVFFINLALLFVAFVLILKVARGLLISLEFWEDRFFQFFMYLCAFEILPVLILVKFLLYHVNL